MIGEWGRGMILRAHGTLVTIRAEDVPPGIRPEDHADGMNSSLDKLAAFLSDQPG